MKDLRIETEPRESGGYPVQLIRVVGYVDASSFPRFEEEMQGLIDGGHFRLLLDLREATYMCSTALGLLMKVFGEVRQKSGDLVIAEMPEKIANIFNLLGFSRLIPAFASVEEALRCLGTAEPA
ncbi:MAG TPA: STAS domain-containing protein [Armatimonadota bacterium]|nr:STAS domain-containing protein [Armatimonadota bacterium]